MPKCIIRYQPLKVSGELVRHLTGVMAEFIASSLPIPTGKNGYVSAKQVEINVDLGNSLDVTPDDLSITVRAYYSKERKAALDPWKKMLSAKVRGFLNAYYKGQHSIKGYVEIELMEHVELEML